MQGRAQGMGAMQAAAGVKGEPAWEHGVAAGAGRAAAADGVVDLLSDDDYDVQSGWHLCGVILFRFTAKDVTYSRPR